LADQTQNIVNLEEELKKKKELHERAKKILGKYYNDFFNSEERKFISSKNIDLTEIINIKQEKSKTWRQFKNIKTTKQTYSKYFQEIEKRKNFFSKGENEEKDSEKNLL